MSGHRERGLYIPRQHGAWAMLAVPLLVGIAASRPTPLDLAILVAAVAGYLLSAALSSAVASRDRSRYRNSILLFGTVAVLAAAFLLVAAPELAFAGVVVGPSALPIAWLASRRRSRALLASLASAAQASVLAPCVAWVGNMHDAGDLARVSFVTGVYLFGSVLAVRSVIRERGNGRFWVASLAIHALAAGVAWFVLPLPAAVVVTALAVRAALLPAVAQALAARGTSLRPVFVGIGEAAAGIALVLGTLASRP